MPRAAPMPPPASSAPARQSSITTYPCSRTIERKFISLGPRLPVTVSPDVVGPRLRLLHVSQADRRGWQAHQVLGQHLQLGSRASGVLLGVVLGQPPPRRAPPQRLLHGRGRAARGLRRPFR